MLLIYMTLHIKFERNQISGAQGMHPQKLSNFLHIFFFSFLNQAHAGHRLALTWFLEIDPVWIVGMRVRVCVRTRGY